MEKRLLRCDSCGESVEYDKPSDDNITSGWWIHSVYTGKISGEKISDNIIHTCPKCRIEISLVSPNLSRIL